MTEEEGKCLTKGKDNLLCDQGASSLLRPLLNIIDCPASQAALHKRRRAAELCLLKYICTAVFHCSVCCLIVAVGFNYFQTVDWSHWDSYKPRIKTINGSSVLILPSELLHHGVRSQLE